MALNTAKIFLQNSTPMFVSKTVSSFKYSFHGITVHSKATHREEALACDSLRCVKLLAAILQVYYCMYHCVQLKLSWELCRRNQIL